MKRRVNSDETGVFRTSGLALLSLCLLAQGFFIVCCTKLFRQEEGIKMDSRIALIGIVIENTESAEKINAILHEYGEYIVGRMGIPYHKRHISVISVVMDAPNDVISALSGKLGMLPHVSTKTVYSKLPASESLE